MSYTIIEKQLAKAILLIEANLQANEGVSITYYAWDQTERDELQKASLLADKIVRTP